MGLALVNENAVEFGSQATDRDQAGQVNVADRLVEKAKGGDPDAFEGVYRAVLSEVSAALSNNPMSAPAELRSRIEGRVEAMIADEAAAPPEVSDDRAKDTARGVASATMGKELTASGFASFADDLGESVLDRMSAAERISSLVIPGLSVRDVRVVGPAPEREATVVVVQELADGREVELWFSIESDDRAALVGTGVVRAERESSDQDGLQQSRGLEEAPLPTGWR